MRIGMLLLLALAGCAVERITFATDFDDGRMHMLGTPLDATHGTRLLCWPADERGTEFRFVGDRFGRPMRDAAVGVVKEDDLPPGPKGSVIAILPPDPTPELRARARAVMDRLTRDSPSAGQHVVVADAPWYDVDDGEEVARRLHALHERARAWRLTAQEDGIFVAFEEMDALSPHLTVVPLEGDRFVVLVGLRREPAGMRWRAESECDLARDGVLELAASAGDAGSELRLLVHIVVPEAAGESARDRSLALAADLLARAPVRIYLTRSKSRDVATGKLRSGEFEPPYVLDLQAFRESAQ